MLGVFPVMPRLEMDLDCTDEEWDAFVKRVKDMGDAEIEKMKARMEQGEKEPPPPKMDPSLLYYWSHLMGGGDDS